MSHKRVVITGLGLITPIGTGVEKFWQAAVRGENGIRLLEQFDASEYRTKTGGEIRDFKAEQFLDNKEIARMGRSSQFACAAALMAIEDAGIDISKVNPYRIGVSMGTTMGEPQVLEHAMRIKYAAGDASQIPSELPRQYPCAVLPANIARVIGSNGPTIMIPTACAAGNYAIGYAFDLIQLDKIEVAVAGGSDPFSKIAFTGFNRLLATTPDVCRPFAKNRPGMAVSEGAGILILETLDHARERKAQIYAEIAGYGLGCDAFKMTIPDPEGSGGILCLRKALHNSEISPDEVDYVSAHGTGTGENDKSETFILKEVFGKRAYSIPVSSQKSMLGHTMGAASAIEAAACALMIKHQTALPTINYNEPDPECDLDYVPNEAREMKIDAAVSNAYAFAGNTSSLVLKRFKG